MSVHQAKQMTISMAVAILVLSGTDVVQGQKATAWYQRGPVNYEKRLKLTIQNPSDGAREEEPVVVKIADIRKTAPDFPGKGVLIIDPEAAPQSPCRLESGGNEIPLQLDDTDGDGAPDELVFLATVRQKTKTLYAYYTVKDITPPLYPRRTLITSFEFDPNTLFAIESESGMYSFVRPGPKENSFMGDAFSKPKERPGYSQFLYSAFPWFLHPKGSGGWHMQTTMLGRCILDPGDLPGQLGIGSILGGKGGALEPAKGKEIKVRILCNGMVRSVGEICLNEWTVGESSFDLTLRVTMYGSRRHAECEAKIIRQVGSDGVNFGVGMMKLDNGTGTVSLADGMVCCWGDRTRLGEKDNGIAMIVPKDQVADIKEAEKHYLAVFKPGAASGNTAVFRYSLSAGSKESGYYESKEDFVAYHQRLSVLLANPLRVEVAGGAETRPDPTATVALTSKAFFVTNPSNKANVLPVELDLPCYGLNAAGKGVECADQKCRVDCVRIDGREKLFVQMTVKPMKTEKITLKTGTGESKAGFQCEEISEGGAKGVVIRGKGVEWLVTAKGLEKIKMAEGGELRLVQPAMEGEVKVLHNGEVVAVVRAGNEKIHHDYYFYQDAPIVKIVTDQEIVLRGVMGSSSYVAKKEITGEACEKLEVSRWGRVTSERVFTKTSLRYPAEWAALGNKETNLVVMLYGSPSSGDIFVEKGGQIRACPAKPGDHQEVFVAPLKKVEDGEDQFALMSKMLVSTVQGDGFLSMGYFDGNETPDAIRVEDRNGNQKPDLAGDKWFFDMNCDDALQSILEFEPDAHDKNKPHVMKVYCDTVTGNPELHSTLFHALYGNDSPCAEKPTAISFWAKTSYYDGCLSPYEEKKPFLVYEDWNNDGLFFKGPVTEGGFVSSGKIMAGGGGPMFCETPGTLKNYLLECWDLDDDGDNDIWWIKMINPPPHFFAVPPGGDYLHWGHFDLSDNNLEPLTFVDAYRGRASWAVRAAQFIDSDNGKIYQLGYQKGDEYFAQFDWPFPSGWDIDNDGAAEGHLYINIRLWMFALDLEKGVDGNDPLIKDKIFLEKDQLYTRPTRHENFCLFIRERGPDDPWPNEYLEQRFNAVTIKDPHGHTMRFHGLGVPDGWKGEARQCKQWPNGEYDYLESNGWSDAMRKTHYVAAAHWIGSLWRTAHEGNWGGNWFNPEYRYEANPDGTETGGPDAYRLYYSPILNALHLKGLRFGVQVVPPLARDARQEVQNNHSSNIRSKYASAYSYSAVGFSECGNPEKRNNDYSREARKCAPSFLYYTDRDRDGYVDTYILDDDKDGIYEKRIWHDKSQSVLTMYDRGQLAVIPMALTFPEYSLALKNYANLVPLRRQSDESKSMLYLIGITNNAITGLEHEFSIVFAPQSLPKVALDTVRLDKKSDLLSVSESDTATDVLMQSELLTKPSPWSDFKPAGLDTLGRVFSEAGVSLETLSGNNFAQSLDGVDVLVIKEVGKPYGENDVKALQAFLAAGNMILLLWPEDAKAPGAAGMRSLAVALGVEGVDNRPFQAEPKMKDEELEAMLKAAKDTTGKLMEGVKRPIFVEGKEMAAGKQVKPLLEYAGSVLIVEAPVGKGKVVICASKLLENHFMSLEVPLRFKPYKAGNQQLAANLGRYLFGDRAVKVADVIKDKGSVKLKMSGKGGKVFLKVPWADAKVSVNGKAEKTERSGDTLTLTLPPGPVELKVEGNAKGG